MFIYYSITFIVHSFFPYNLAVIASKKLLLILLFFICELSSMSISTSSKQLVADKFHCCSVFTTPTARFLFIIKLRSVYTVLFTFIQYSLVSMFLVCSMFLVSMFFRLSELSNITNTCNFVSSMV